ncbi:MAG: leucine-rich repeat protein [Oscillospiraceae bacterium]|nr:leucine-rich repeat protein [Oscillospiraceae bacterium]
MKTKRFCAALGAAAVLALTVRELPPVTAAAAKTVSLMDFAAAMKKLTAQDAERDIFGELIFDKAAGTLSADGGDPTDSAGGLTVSSGELYLDTAQSGRQSGISAQSVVEAVRFADAAEENGYTVRECGDSLRITNEFQTARLIVKAAGVIDQHGAKDVAEGYRDLHILQYDTPAAAYAAYLLYSADAAVQYVQPSHRITVTADESGDTHAASYNTWGAEMMGIPTFTKTYLNAEVLPEVKVAVIDTGIDPRPEIFDGRLLDCGFNFSGSGNDTPDDDLYHGTHVAGTICELTPRNVKLLPVKSFDSSGSTSDEQIYAGIMYALEQGADIVNMSFGGLGVSPLEVEAMEVADEAGMICIASAGNNADDAGYYYPGSIESCITVGAVDINMAHPGFSNTGKSLDVVAPGVDILSYTLGENTLEKKNGTSMATPHVAACCALLRSYDKEITPRRAEALLRLNAVDIGEPGFDDAFGWGFACMSDFRWDDGICPAPEYSLKSGNYGKAKTVELTADSPDMQIYYTTDGSVPTKLTGTLYTEPLTITETTHLLAVCVQDDWLNSVPAEAVYMISGKDVPDALKIADGVVTAYSGVLEELTVPDTYDGQPVTAIGAAAFADNHFVKEITLPDTITKIGDAAFSSCVSLKQVTAAGAEEIGAKAFANDTALAEVSLGDTWTVLGPDAFSGCTSIKTLSAPGIRQIPENTFLDCTSLSSVSFPDASVINAKAFAGCSSLTDIRIPFEKVSEIGAFAFAGCQQWQDVLQLPALKSLSEGAFQNARSLRGAELSESITALPDSAFEGCESLRILKLPGVTSIGAYALAANNGTDRTVLTLDCSKITEVGEYAFRGFTLGSAYARAEFSALTEISEHSFSGVRVGSIALPYVKAVPDNAFAECSLLCVELPNAERIGNGALTGCRAAFLTKQLRLIAADALMENMWIITYDTLPIPKNAPAYQTCAEPFVMHTAPGNQEVSAHTNHVLDVLACGKDLTYQWYVLDGETEHALDGETASQFTPDTAETGVRNYRCRMTDSTGMTEQVDFRITVSSGDFFKEAATDTLYTEDGSTSAYYTFTPSESGIYALRTYGAAGTICLMTDAAGNAAAFSAIENGETVLRAELTAGTPYYFEISGLWKDSYSVILSESRARYNLADCSLRITATDKVPYDAAYHPTTSVTAPDGTALNENTDYIIRYEAHDQYQYIHVYGIGDYYGSIAETFTVYQQIREDTVIPAAPESRYDPAVYVFIPKVSAVYNFYASPGEGYAEDYMQRNRVGSFRNAQYAGFQTNCMIANTPDGSETVYARADYSEITGTFFRISVMLRAGQTYYLLCGANAPAKYTFTVTQNDYDIRQATVSGMFNAEYDPDEQFTPKVNLTLNGEKLIPGKDFQIIARQHDVPGKSEITIIGCGLYYGQIIRTAELIYSYPELPDSYITERESISVTCADSRLTILRFKVTEGATPNAVLRYRIVNERRSGGYILTQLFRYLPEAKMCSRISPMAGETNDYQLTNGEYCVVCCREFADAASAANITILQPYSLAEAAVEITDMPYTGSEVPCPVTVTASDGTLLEEGKDFKVTYKDSNVLFGECAFSLRPTNTSFGIQDGTFNIYVSIPEDVPELETGSHSVKVTLDDRLACFRITPDTDMSYLLGTTDVPNTVLRVFSEDLEMLEQDYGTGTNAVKFTVPAGETRYLMVKFNGEEREGTINFRLETALHLLADCEVITTPQTWTGGQITPPVQFIDGDYILTEGKDYVLRYTADDVNVGTATANYYGIGDYYGVCDVQYQIVVPNLETLQSEDCFPILLNETYYADEIDTPYVLFSYQGACAAELNLLVFDARCRLSVQVYDSQGELVSTMFMKSRESLPLSYPENGETYYFLFAPTDVSGTNRAFNLILQDKSNPGMERLTDEEGGVVYRISQESGYAEAYGLAKDFKGDSQLILKPEIDGLPVQLIPEALFAILPEGTVVIGYPGCPAADYADQYGFIYQESAASAVTGDINGDGRCSEADITTLLAFMTEYNLLDPERIVTPSADLNGDGILDLLDIRILQSLLNDVRKEET